MADFDQSGVDSISGFCAASDSASTVDFFFSHSSEFDDTATTRLPSFAATASSTVFGWGFRDSSKSLAHWDGFFLPVLNVDRYSSRTVTPVSFLVFLMASVISDTFDPSRFSVSVMLSVAVMPVCVSFVCVSSAHPTGVMHNVIQQHNMAANSMKSA